MIFEDLKSAIDKQLIINLEYGGERLVEPYIIYETSKGKRLVDCYQLNGYSSSGIKTGWKRFDISLIRNIQFTSNVFEIRSEYNPDNSGRYYRILYKN